MNIVRRSAAPSRLVGVALFVGAAWLAACGKGTPGPAAAPPDLVEVRRARVFLTSRAGDSMRETGAVSLVAPSAESAPATTAINVFPNRERQVFLGVGGSLTQASAAALSKLSEEKRAEVLAAYFGPDGAGYALSRTHVGSSDFSEYSYSYAPDADPSLAGFSIDEDRQNGLLQLITDAQAVPGASFQIVASPWTAPPWMKDNGQYYEPGRGGRLLAEHYDTFARYFVAYLQAYQEAGVDIWALTPVNEPMGNGGNWESMEMSPTEQRDFIRVLGPRLKEAELEKPILIFDQNRAEMPAYTQVIFGDEVASPFAYGTAVHWYNSTFRVYEDVLDAQHELYPDKVIIHTEGTIDSVSAEASCNQQCLMPPCGCEELYAWWQDDAWYWEKEATDWGWDWAPNREVDHPKYAPAFRYARDLVVGMGHWLAGWIDWNIVLDKRGGPNHVNNFCLAPVMVDGETDSVYYTPLFYIVKQISRHSRPGGVVLETSVEGSLGLQTSAIRNPDGTIALHVFNEGDADVAYLVRIGEQEATVTSPAGSLQTLLIEPEPTG
ncbi:MAG: glycosyl hydrolase family 30 [Deltaproteobacteria bacterium]|nr:glycosyl hydrolase family 30 [Deltaproteobacteria bacterium]NNK07625.1 glycoside hydrolase family 30 protein [Myxococcales bacterium]NNK44601.1 glycoside hydrolase family 30 protein [Myxococcales bacterium]RZV55243.1 MAG: glycosyl hydrolase family 30 [Deltaproteobacteria bacterium]